MGYVVGRRSIVLEKHYASPMTMTSLKALNQDPPNHHPHSAPVITTARLSPPPQISTVLFDCFMILPAACVRDAKEGGP